jgi:hypothetical protein
MPIKSMRSLGRQVRRLPKEARKLPLFPLFPLVPAAMVVGSLLASLRAVARVRQLERRMAT